VEWFDFMVYLSLAPVLARVFFAADSRSSLLVTLGIFAAAFLSRSAASLLGPIRSNAASGEKNDYLAARRTFE
jgi:hypothetical protein